MNLQVPSDLFYKCKGIAVCLVHLFCDAYRLWSYIKVNGEGLDGVCFGVPLSEEFGKVESHHYFLRYLSFSRGECKRALNQSDANGFIQIEIICEPIGPGLEIMKCGAHLVYKEDLNQTMGGCSITPYEDDVDDSAKEDTAP